MQERRELHALAARELRQSVADDQRLERVRSPPWVSGPRFGKRRACHYKTRADHQTGAERSFETRRALLR